ncbi:MAG: AAC(3) family N-acetyltransferase [Magnetococcales bacterium]|nr:AAC(3) family N-acetyltransferase [Magnetococcales bacterium]NGZ28413.1 AAC(3) family N-acetyltransferase [Magnetococcales bacterium]
MSDHGLDLSPSLTSRWRLTRIRLQRRWEKLCQPLRPATLSLEALTHFLQEVGFQPGATLLVHSAMDAIGQVVPELSPFQLIQIMKNLVGEEGTLLMPSFPFRGREAAYVAENKVFQPFRTPSRMGLLSEVFRRMPEVKRSWHPTHAVCGLGPQADFLLKDHHLGETYGKSSPFARLAEVGGRVISLGVGIESFTLFMVAEYGDPRWREQVFAKEPVHLQVVGQDGKEFTYRFLPSKLPHERFYPLEMQLLAHGILHRWFRHGLVAYGAEAKQLVDGYAALMERGLTLFPTH